MRITLVATVTQGQYWSEDAVQNEVEIKTDAPDPGILPWAQICANLVETAIAEYQAQVTAAQAEGE